MSDGSLEPGAYSELITQSLSAILGIDDTESSALIANVNAAEAPDRLARHLYGIVVRVVASLDEPTRVERAGEIAAHVVRLLDELRPGAGTLGDQPASPLRLLEGIRARRPDGTLSELELPLTSLLDTTVLTNARGEPAIQHELSAEIPSAVSVDILMAFVRWSGVRPLLQALQRHRDAGGRVRLITTTYTNSTEARALDALAAIGAEVRVSYDTSTTRLHAKAWLFHRARGATTAYIGSSNLTHSAQVVGLEWNVRVSGLHNPAVVSKMAAVFESYWESDDFVPYDRDRVPRAHPGGR